MRVDFAPERSCARLLKQLFADEKQQIKAKLRERGCPDGGERQVENEFKAQGLRPAISVRTSYRCRGLLRRRIIAYCFERVPTPAPAVPL